MLKEQDSQLNSRYQDHRQSCYKLSKLVVDTNLRRSALGMRNCCQGGRPRCFISRHSQGNAGATGAGSAANLIWIFWRLDPVLDQVDRQWPRYTRPRFQTTDDLACGGAKITPPTCMTQHLLSLSPLQLTSAQLSSLRLIIHHLFERYPNNNYKAIHRGSSSFYH